MVCVSDVIDFVELAPPNIGCWDWIGSDGWGTLKINRPRPTWDGGWKTAHFDHFHSRLEFVTKKLNFPS